MVVAFGAISNAFSESGEIEWDVTLGTGIGTSVEETDDGGFIISGYFRAAGKPGEPEPLLIKTDSNGRKLWAKSYNQYGEAYSVHETIDGGFIICGGHIHGYLMKTDSSGYLTWINVLEEYCEFSSVELTDDGGFIISGEKSGQGLWLVKTDSQGNVEWSRTFEEAWLGKSVKQTSDGGYIITSTNSFSDPIVFYIGLMKTNSAGFKEWDKMFNECYWAGGNSVQQTIDGGYILTGGIMDDLGNKNLILIKTDSLGNEEWNKIFGGTGNSVQQTIDGGYIITGSNEFDGGYRLLVIKTDSGGNEEWNRTFGESVFNGGNSVQQTSDGSYIITGYTSGTTMPDAVIRLIKIKGSPPPLPCKWTGRWDTADWGEIELQQSDDLVTGSFLSGEGKIEGTVSGDKLTGTWSEAPTYSPPRHAGDLELIMSKDCNSFSGNWRFGTSGDWFGEWNGMRI
jgi:hypothetical protein